MANMPDENTGWHSRNQLSTKWWDSRSSCQILKVPEGSGKDDYPPLGQVPGPWSLWNRPGCLLTLLWWSDFGVAWSLSWPSPWLCMGLQPLWMECQQWMAVGTLHGLFPPQGLGDLCNKGGRHRGLESDRGWWGINSQSGVAGAPTVAVTHLAGVAGWPSLWDVEMDPLWQALLLWVWLFGDSCGKASIDHGEVISIHLDGTVVMKTSPSAKVMSSSIAHQSSCTILTRLWGWLGTGGCNSSAQCCRALA